MENPEGMRKQLQVIYKGKNCVLAFATLKIIKDMSSSHLMLLLNT